MSEVVVEQAPLDPATLEAYAGKWVAVREGVVVAWAESLEGLRDNDEVRREDAVYVVPESGHYFY